MKDTVDIEGVEYTVDQNGRIGRIDGIKGLATKKEVAKTYDYYIAAPFFNPDQLIRVELVKEILTNRGLTFFSPKDDAKCEDINDSETRKRVFELDHKSIANSRGVIAITDGKDPGTIWEAGYAYAKDVPIIYVAFTLGVNGQFNLMLAESGIAACRTVEELKSAIDGEKIYFKGEIE